MADYYRGHHAIVRPLTADDLFLLYPQPAVAAILPAYRPWQGVSSIASFAERLEWLASFEPPPEVEALVLNQHSGTPIGFLCLAAVDLLNGKAEFAAAFFHGRGSRAALEALHWALEAAFTKLELHKLVFYVLADNSPAHALLRRLGIPREGLLREELASPSGGRSDLVRYALFRRDWLSGSGRTELQRLAPLCTAQMI